MTPKQAERLAREIERTGAYAVEQRFTIHVRGRGATECLRVRHLPSGDRREVTGRPDWETVQRLHAAPPPPPPPTSFHQS